MNTEMCCADVCLTENKTLPGVSFLDVMERDSRDSFFCIALIPFSLIEWGCLCYSCGYNLSLISFMKA